MKRFLLTAAALTLLAFARAEEAPPAPSTAAAHEEVAAPDAFCQEAARLEDVPAEKVQELRRRGFGKTEALSFIAVSRASSLSWEELLKVRERGTPLRRMAADAGLDYNALFESSSRTRCAIEAAVGGESAPALSRSSETVNVAP